MCGLTHGVGAFPGSLCAGLSPQREERLVGLWPAFGQGGELGMTDFEAHPMETVTAMERWPTAP
ncbi:hypothetical protein ACIRL2_26865 [Embleya sp. NPDC127516]|uniref:hypothetical protein n=1 Tax=Embleya sp. NPDC127516 TaxID=3363990 RepID=UPI0038243A24